MVMLTCLLTATLLAQPAARVGTGVHDLDERLAALAPSRPNDYFLLAEEVASEIGTDEGRALARRLFVLSYEFSRAGVDPHNLSGHAFE